MTASEAVTSVEIPGVVRAESTSRPSLVEILERSTRDSYPHELVYGRYCTVHEWIHCAPDELFTYLADARSLEEWSYSIRSLRRVDGRGGRPDTGGDLYCGVDLLEPDAHLYCRVVANPYALTVDYHSAWDETQDLWMVELLRLVPAEETMARPGTVVIWTCCRHPNFERNPHLDPGTARARVWVGDYWRWLPAAHILGLRNLKAIVEYRVQHDIPLTAAFSG